MENFTPVASLIGGILIGLSVSIMLLFNGRVTGISGILGALIQFNSDEKSWRSIFLLGLVIGGLLFQPLQLITSNVYHKSPVIALILGGILVGFGARMGNGCTSGHGICGIARFSKRSIIATLTFMTAGMLTASYIQPIIQQI